MQGPCRNRGVLRPEAGILLLMAEEEDDKVAGQSLFSGSGLYSDCHRKHVCGVRLQPQAWPLHMLL